MKSLHPYSRFGARRTIVTLGLGCALGALAVPSSAQSLFRQISQDSFTDQSSQHASEVEPGAAVNGPVIVAAFQVARISSGGSDDIGWAISLNGGISWTNGYLPGLTQWEGGGPNSAASDAAVAYNKKFGKWLICSLAVGTFNTVTVSRSSNGVTWDNPIYVIQNRDADKNWIACDNSPSSPHYGNCYVEWDDPDVNGRLYMSTSNDGGVSWGTPMATAANDEGIGGNPEVQPNGNVVVPFADDNGGMSSFMSSNGGQSWTAAVSIASAPTHREAGGLRSPDLPSAAIDGAGTVYLSWPDCSFESGCSANDIVYSSTTDGVHWTSKTRIPLDPIGSGVDHFINGMGIDVNTSGSGAHMAMTYYYYPVSNCGNSCTLYAGFSLTSNGGQTWTAGRQIGAPMQLSWLPKSGGSSRMVADYVATVFPAGGRAFPIFEQAFQPQNGLFNQGTYTTSYGYRLSEMTEPQMSSAGEVPIPGIKSDHPQRQPGDVDNPPPSMRSKPELK